ncbi:hypothetical protein M9H77_36499 [Catharanthus roseus]|uniref:Uncharacterized protein n=1 Tax=Catharanthus roseus TaxID=4058 RepID=A0ACB9ZS02_CATRO|nr:hypothetical protein M9H77_36499 [Catharanthus roseus]
MKVTISTFQLQLETAIQLAKPPKMISLTNLTRISLSSTSPNKFLLIFTLKAARILSATIHSPFVCPGRKRGAAQLPRNHSNMSRTYFFLHRSVNDLHDEILKCHFDLKEMASGLVKMVLSVLLFLNNQANSFGILIGGFGFNITSCLLV